MAAPMEGLWVFDSPTIIACLKFTCLFYLTVCTVLYVLIILKIFTPNKMNIPDDSKILIITAHPDDECMFFSPVIISSSSSHSVHLLSTTSGNYYNQGPVRKKEILESCQILGMPKQNVDVLDDSSFPDGPDVSWSTEKLQHEIKLAVDRIHPDFILTFDDRGVSGHPNHISVSKVARQMFASKDSHQVGTPRLFQLESVSLLRKYISFLDLPLSIAANRLTFVSSISEVLQAQRAMYAHYSQFVWFRILYIVFSRYMIINTFVEIES